MKVVLFVMSVLFFISCVTLNHSSTPNYRIVEKRVDYFDEWNITRITGVNVLKRGPIEDSQEIILNPEKLCANLFGNRRFWGGKIYADELSGNLLIECFSMNVPMKSDFFDMEFLVSIWDGLVGVKDDSLYHVVYGGDSLRVISGMFFNHRMICNNENIENCSLNEKTESLRKKIYFDGPFFEISIPANQSFFSITIQTNPNDLEGYKPLQLDSSILPLESPGYKKLREYEESLKCRE